jgi:ATP-binding cassette subfamily B protein
MATGAAVVFLLFILSTVIIFALPKFKIIQRLTDNLNRVTREHLTGLRVVRAYNAEPYQDAKFEKANAELTATNLFTFRILAIMFPSIGFIMSGIGLAIYWIGAYLINAAQMQDRLIIFSDMVVFSSYAIMVIMSFMMLAMIFVMLPRAAVSAKRINEVLDTEAKIIDGTRTESLPGAEGEIEFRNVSFRYPDAADDVLRKISFKARKGETVAIIGSTGSGKTTLVNLVPRFYDATEGEVIVGGINVKEYSQEALRKKIGYVSQRAVLFSGTIASNVMIGERGSAAVPDRIGRSAGAVAGMSAVSVSGEGSADALSGGEAAAGAALDAEQLQAVKRAVDIAQGTEFIEKMEGQYGASVSQGGANLSGGQKQRLSIARAIYRNPEIYIFDDTFSALDYRTDRALRAALKRETAGATTLIVAQRIGTIKDADQIIVLEEGEIVGIGTHDELMATCRTYQEIAYSQLSKEELAHERQ